MSFMISRISDNKCEDEVKDITFSNVEVGTLVSLRISEGRGG